MEQTPSGDAHGRFVYAAPQLHAHAVIFNVAERDNGQTRALQPHQIFVSQRYVTAVYRSELALRLEKLGYELERGKHGQLEIKGYTKEYLEASSPRREQIKDHLREQGIDGAAAAQIATHHTRDRKELLSRDEVLRESGAPHAVAQQVLEAAARAYLAAFACHHDPDRSTPHFQQAGVEFGGALHRGFGRTKSFLLLHFPR
jgi:hypothetical protein